MNRTWKQLLANHDEQEHRTSKQEIQSLRNLIRRDLADASLDQLSADRRFATAYNAVLQTSNIAIACSGYRITARTGHHRVAFECLRLIFGKTMDSFADYMEVCRRKRNVIDYMHSQIASQSESREILEQAKRFLEVVEGWIVKQHPSLI